MVSQPVAVPETDLKPRSKPQTVQTAGERNRPQFLPERSGPSDRAPVGLLTLNKHGKVLEANPTLCSLLRTGPRRIAGKTFVQFVEAASRAKFRQHLRAAFTRVLKQEFEIQLQRTDGTRFCANLKAIAIGPRLHRRKKCTMAVMDLGQRWRAEEVLCEAEERLARAASAARIGLFEWRVKTGEVLWTDETSALLGMPVKKRRTRPIFHPHSYSEWAARVHPDDLSQLQRKLKRCVSTGSSFENEYRVVWPDGRIRWLHGRGIFKYDEKGKPERMLGLDMDVTERVRTEEALRDSEARYRALFEQSADGIVVINKQGKIVMANRGLENLFGYRRGELLGQSVEMLVPERLRKSHVHRREAYQASPRLQPMRRGSNLFGRRKDGSEFPIEISLNAVTPSNDGLATGIVRDVTDRAQLEATLKNAASTLQERVSERTELLTSAYAELRGTLESIGDGFVACDRDWRLIYLNRAAEKVLGFRREDVLGKTFWELFPETIGTKLEREYRAAAAGEAREFENLYEPWNRWFYNRCYPREAGGASIYFTEITEHKRAEQALKQSQEYLRAIIDNAPVAILSMDEQGTIKSINPAAVQLFGYSEQEMLGQDLSRFMATAHQEPGERFLPHFLQTAGKPMLGLRREVLGRQKGGKTIMLELTIAEFELEQRPRFVAMARDITALKRLERELLEGAERERQRLGHDLHDGLGQHLHALYYRATLLHKDLREASSSQAMEAMRLSKLLHQAIDLARGLARGLQPVPAIPEGLMTSLRELAQRTRELYEVDCRFECATPVLVQQHNAATHLYRIAQEAVNNAMRHGHPSRIRIKLGGAADRILLGIRDNGVGIRRGASNNRGLGLHIMQYRANALSGSLVVQRTPKGGTEVVCSTRRESLQKEETNNNHRNENETTIAKP